MEIQDLIGDSVASLVQRGKDDVHPAVVMVSAVEVEVRVLVMLEILDPGAADELVHIGRVSCVLQVVGMFLAVTYFEMWKTQERQ